MGQETWHLKTRMEWTDERETVSSLLRERVKNNPKISFLKDLLFCQVPYH